MFAKIDDALLTACAWVVTHLHRDERGQDLLEYALLGGLIALAITAAGVVAAMTGGLNSMAEGIKDCIDFKTSAGSECAPFIPN